MPESIFSYLENCLFTTTISIENYYSHSQCVSSMESFEISIEYSIALKLYKTNSSSKFNDFSISGGDSCLLEKASKEDRVDRLVIDQELIGCKDYSKEPRA